MAEANQTNTNETNLPGAFSLFGPSWEAVKLNFGTFLMFILVPVAMVTAALLLSLPLHDSNIPLFILWVLVGTLVIAFFLIAAPALVYTQLQSVRRREVEFQEAFNKGRGLVWPFLGLSLLVGLIIIGGFILLIVPGIFMIKRYLLAPYLLVDKNLGIKEAMRESTQISQKYANALWGVIGVELLISLVGSVPIAGSAISFVLSIAYYCAPAVRYEQIKTLPG